MIKVTRRDFFKVFGAGAGALTLASLAGCGNDSGSASDGSDDNAKPVKGGHITVSYVDAPTTMFIPASSNTIDRIYTVPALESLGRVDKDGNITPWLAKDFTVDKDALTLTISVRDNVKFSDDSPCDAEAIAWNLQQYLDNGHKSELDNPASVEAQGDKVIVHYDKFLNDWTNVIALCQMCSKKSYEENGKEWAAAHPVGTGPFVLESYTAGNSLSYKRNDNYRIEDQPYLDGISFTFVKDVNTQIASMENNEVNVLITRDATAVQTLGQAGIPDKSAHGTEANDIFYIIPNSVDPKYPTSNLDVRKAILHCIDWENVAKSISGGLGKATPQFALEGSWAYNPDIQFPEYDPEKGKKMLADAGFPNGFDTKIYCISSNEKAGTAFQSCLSQIGINASMNVIDPSLLASMQKKDSVDGFVVGRGSSKVDFLPNYKRLYSKEGIKNKGMMVFPDDWEELLDKAGKADSLDEKKKMEQELSKMLAQTYIMLIPLGTWPTCCFEDSKVHNIGLIQTVFEQWTPETAFLAQ